MGEDVYVTEEVAMKNVVVKVIGGEGSLYKILGDGCAVINMRDLLGAKKSSNGIALYFKTQGTLLLDDLHTLWDF